VVDENVLILNEFYKIGRLLSTEKNTLKLLDIILSSSIKLTSSDAGTIYLVVDMQTARYSSIKANEYKDKMLKFAIAKNISIDTSLEKTLSPLTENSIVGYSAITGKSIRIDDAYNIPPHLEYKHNHKFDEDTGYITKSVLSVPMKDNENNVSGVIQLINKKRNAGIVIDYMDKNYKDNILPYEYTDELIMNSLAGQAAVALQNNILSSDMEKLLQEYMQQNEQLFILSKKVLISHEEERKRIVRDIHDGPAQSIAFFSLKIEVCKNLLKNRELDKLSKELEQIKHSLKYTLNEVRTILYNLKPSFLEDGIVEALINYVDTYKENYDINVNLQISGNDPGLEYYMTSAIYRIVQECLTNIVKHSLAKNAFIDFSIQNKNISFTISDDGKGFDVASIEPRNTQSSNKGLGLNGIRERVALLRGKAYIMSSIGKGTTIKVDIPIP
jgi:signal transduction histidine kinase